MKLNWVDDPQAESHLSSLGLSWTRADVHLREVDIETSKRNNARYDKPVCEETALEYACALQSGSKFPSPVFYRNGGQRYLLASGNHRSGGVMILKDEGDIEEADCVFWNAYVITSTDKMLLELFIRASNRWQGRRQSKTEALLHARWMMQKYNMDLNELAKQFFLSPKWLKERLRSDEIRQQLEKLGTPTSHLKDSMILVIGRLGFNEKLMQRAAYVAEEYKLNGEAIKTMVDATRISGQAGEQEGIAKIKELEQSFRAVQVKVPTIASPIATRRPVRARFFSHINAFHNFMRCGNKGKEFDRLDDLQITDKHDRHEAHQIWKQLRKKMDTIFHNAHAQEQVKKCS